MSTEGNSIAQQVSQSQPIVNPNFVEEPKETTTEEALKAKESLKTPEPISEITTTEVPADKNGRDDDALSSLLLLLKSNSNKAEESENIESARRNSQLAVDNKLPRNDTNLPLSKTIKIDDLRQYFHLPIVEVAKQLGTCTTALKKICRKNRIKKWPYRQIRSITKSVQSLEMASMNEMLSEEVRQQYREQIGSLQKAIDDLIRDPNTPISLVNMTVDADDDDDFENNPSNNTTSSTSTPQVVQTTDFNQVMQAAAATAGIEASSRNASTLLKKKSLSSLNENNNKNNPSATATTTKEQEDEKNQNIPLIGSTTVHQLPFHETGRHKVIFMAPVQLAVLQRKKITSNKKLVPLIEPDICNHFDMDFLPQSILRVRLISSTDEGSDTGIGTRTNISSSSTTINGSGSNSTSTTTSSSGIGDTGTIISGINNGNGNGTSTSTMNSMTTSAIYGQTAVGNGSSNIIGSSSGNSGNITMNNSNLINENNANNNNDNYLIHNNNNNNNISSNNSYNNNSNDSCYNNINNINNSSNSNDNMSMNVPMDTSIPITQMQIHIDQRNNSNNNIQIDNNNLNNYSNNINTTTTTTNNIMLYHAENPNGLTSI